MRTVTFTVTDTVSQPWGYRDPHRDLAVTPTVTFRPFSIPLLASDTTLSV